MKVTIAGRVTLPRGSPSTIYGEHCSQFLDDENILPAFCLLRADTDAIGDFWLFNLVRQR